MAAVNSTMLPLGTPLPAFTLPDALSGGAVSASDLPQARALVVAFICAHCPYVQHLRAAFAAFARDYQGRGVQIIAINSNDPDGYPQDGPDGMRAEAAGAGYAFPYLVDAEQTVAKAFRAACTPDFFVFGPDRRLAYRGQFDGTRPKQSGPEPSGADLRAACDAVLAGTAVPGPQRPSIGCNIKWKPGRAPEWFPA